MVTAALRSYDQHLTDARNRFELGFAARNELLAVEAERKRAELQVIAARSAVELAEANLRRLTGIAPGSRIEPVAADGGGEYSREELETLVDVALSGRLEHAALRARSQGAAASTGAARTSST